MDANRLGKNCGDYNIFTPKTVRCAHPCAQCDSVYLPSTPYAQGPTPADLELRFPPFPEDPAEQLPPPRRNNRRKGAAR